MATQQSNFDLRKETALCAVLFFPNKIHKISVFYIMGINMEIIWWIISLKQILLDHRSYFTQLYVWLIRETVFKNIDKVLKCGQSLGKAVFKCPNCWATKFLNFTCKSRFCTSCSKTISDTRINHLWNRLPRWIWYHHLVFTMPEGLWKFFKKHRKALKLLPRTAADAILYFFQKKCHGVPWIVAVIHTFWAKLNWNSHVHLLVTHWYRSLKTNTFTTVNFSKYFLPYEWVKTSRRTYLIKNLKTRCDQNLKWEYCHQEKKFLNQFFEFHNKEWELSNRYCSFSKYRFGFEQIIGYIWRYVKRPIIAQSRLIDYDGTNVTYSFRDKYDNNQTKTITTNAIDFIWSIVQHIPEKYFHMVYYYGIFSTRSKQKYLPLINQLHPTTRIYNRIPKNYASRMFLFLGFNPLKCSCWGLFQKFCLIIPWYPTIYYDDL